MKKIYQTPDTQEIALRYQQMLASSADSPLLDQAVDAVTDPDDSDYYLDL